MRRPVGVARWVRLCVAGVASTALLVGALAGGSAVWADPETPTAAPSTFRNGSAKATAIVAEIAPGIGTLRLGVQAGTAVAEIQNSLAQSQAQAADTGIVGSSLTAEDCEGNEGTIRPEQLPQPLRVDNRKGNAEAEKDQVGFGSAATGAGRMFVDATTAPSSRAIATAAPIEAGPVATVSNGKADARTRIIDGAAREARATVDATLDIAGIVTLSGLHWEALHRTGANPTAVASFELAAADANGAPLPLDDMGPLESAVNAVLAPSGISVEFPRVERFTEPADLVRITPLRIMLKDSPVGKTALGPALNLSRAQREQLFDQIASVYCRTTSLLLIADVTVSVASGTGFLVLEIGGAEATTGDLVVSDPFSGPPKPLLDLGLPIGLPLASNLLGSDVAAPAARPQPRQLAAIGPLEQVCQSVHPFRWPSCSHGAAMPVGLLGLLLTAGVAGLDFRHQSRRRPAVVDA